MQQVPYAMELKYMNISKRETLDFVKKKISKGCTPKKYYILQVEKASLKLDPSESPLTKILQDIINSTLEYASDLLCKFQLSLIIR